MKLDKLKKSIKDNNTDASDYTSEDFKSFAKKVCHIFDTINQREQIEVSLIFLALGLSSTYQTCKPNKFKQGTEVLFLNTIEIFKNFSNNLDGYDEINDALNEILDIIERLMAGGTNESN